MSDALNRQAARRAARAASRNVDDLSYGLEDVDDIVLEAWNEQITDAEPDPLRKSASVHRGAAYLSPNYPPRGGTSSGQEGGLVDMQETIEVFGDDDHDAAVEAAKAKIKDMLSDMTPPPPPPGDPTTEEVNGSWTRNYGLGVDMLGGGVSATPLVPPRARFALTTTPGGRKITSLVVTKGRLGDPKSSVANAQDVGKRAISVGKKLMAAANKAKSMPARRVLAKKAPTKVHGATPKRKMKLSPTALKKLADRSIKAGQDLLTKAKKLDAIVKTEEKKKSVAKAKMSKAAVSSRAVASKAAAKAPVRAAAPLAAARAVAARTTALRGLDFATDVLGASLDVMYDELLGELHGDVLADEAEEEMLGYYQGNVWIEEDPTNAPTGTDAGTDPGYVDEGYVDDSYIDKSAENNYGLGPAPTEADITPKEGVDFVKDPYPDGAVTDGTSYTTTPKGAIVWAGDPPMSWKAVGSQTRFNGNAERGNSARHAYGSSTGTGTGHILEPDGGWGNSGYQLGGGNAGIMDGWYMWWNGNTDGYQHKKDEAGGGLKELYSKSMQERAQRSKDWGWGPIVGNPDKADFRGMRYNTATNEWFWFYDQAPKSLKQGELTKRLTEALVDFGTKLAAAKAEAAAQALADQLEQEEYQQQLKQQAKEDEANNRRIAQEQQQAEADAAKQATADQTEYEYAARMEQGDAEAENQRAAMEDERWLLLQEKAQEAEERAQEREDVRLFELARMADAEGGEEAYEESEYQEGDVSQSMDPFDSEEEVFGDDASELATCREQLYRLAQQAREDVSGDAELHSLEEVSIPALDDSEEEMLAGRAVTRLRERVAARK